MKIGLVVAGLAAVVAVGGGAWWLFNKQKPKAANKQARVPGQVNVSIADVLNLPKVNYQVETLDLSHLQKGDGWRYHGTVIV